MIPCLISLWLWLIHFQNSFNSNGYDIFSVLAISIIATYHHLQVWIFYKWPYSLQLQIIISILQILKFRYMRLKFCGLFVLFLVGVFCGFVLNRKLQCSSGCPGTHGNPCASASWGPDPKAKEFIKDQEEWIWSLTPGLGIQDSYPPQYSCLQVTALRFTTLKRKLENKMDNVLQQFPSTLSWKKTSDKDQIHDYLVYNWKKIFDVSIRLILY